MKSNLKKELSAFTDQELLTEVQKPTLSPITTALFIGFLGGIALFGIGASLYGYLSPNVSTSGFKPTGFIAALLPLYFIYNLVKGSKRNQEVEKLLKERGLK